MLKNDVYAAIAVKSSGLPANFPSTIKGVSINKDRPVKGEVRRFGSAAFVLPIILALILIPLAAVSLYFTIEFGFKSSQDYRNFVIFPGLIVVIASVLITGIVAAVRICFVKNVKKLANDGQKIQAKVIKLSHDTKYAVTPRHNGGPTMLAVLYEYQNIKNKTLQVKVKFPLSQEHRFFVDKEFTIIASENEKLNLFLEDC